MLKINRSYKLLAATLFLGACAHPVGWYFSEASCDKNDTRCQVTAERLNQGTGDKFTITLPPIPVAGSYARGYWLCTGKGTTKSNKVPVERVTAPCGSFTNAACYVDATDSIQLRKFLSSEEEGNVLTHESYHAVGCHHRNEQGTKPDYDLNEVADLQGTRFSVRPYGAALK